MAPDTPPQPSITEPTLFTDNLPANVKFPTLRDMFKGFLVSRITLTDSLPTLKENRRRQWQPGTQSARVDFPDVAEAEKAFAIVNLRPIPHTFPPVSLHLSPSSEGSPPTPLGNPRIVKHVPPTLTEVQLYALIRPFGPLASVRVDKKHGGIVQFWTENDAKNAEVAAMSRSPKLALQAYGPCDLFCSHLNSDITSTLLEEYFGKCGTITSARVICGANGQSRGYGFVSFSWPQDAANAITTYDGSMWRGRAITVRYQESKTMGKHPRNNQPALSNIKIPEPASPALSDITTCNDSDPPEPSLENVPLDDSKQNINHGSIIVSLVENVVALNAELKAKDDHRAELVQTKEKLDILQREKDELASAFNTSVKELEDEAKKSKAEIRNLNSSLETLREQCTHSEFERKKEVNILNLQIDTLQQAKKVLEGQLEEANIQCNEWRGKFAIADSRCKVLELEADRPLWEEAKRLREKKAKEEEEKAERARREAKVHESERKMRNMLKEERQRKQEEAAKKEREEAAIKAKKEQARRAQEEEKRKQEELRQRELAKERTRHCAWTEATRIECERCLKRDINFSYGRTWTNSVAIARFLVIIETFEKANFSEKQPLVTGNIPWPVLDNPLSPPFQATGVTWEKVEQFFSYVKSSYSTRTPQQYKKLVEKVHRMFHPDKWHSRRILDTVQDQSERKDIETAGNIVAQAMTPLWRDSRG